MIWYVKGIPSSYAIEQSFIILGELIASLQELFQGLLGFSLGFDASFWIKQRLRGDHILVLWVSLARVWWTQIDSFSNKILPLKAEQEPLLSIQQDARQVLEATDDLN